MIPGDRGESGEAFESLLKEKSTGDPTFSFLFHAGSVGNVYYETLKRFERDVGPEAAAERKRIEKEERRKRRWGPPADALPVSSAEVERPSVCATHVLKNCTFSTGEEAKECISLAKNDQTALKNFTQATIECDKENESIYTF